MSAPRDSALSVILETRLVAVVRMKSAEALPAAVDALRRGGVRAIEVTLTTPGVSPSPGSSKVSLLRSYSGGRFSRVVKVVGGTAIGRL